MPAVSGDLIESLVDPAFANVVTRSIVPDARATIVVLPHDHFSRPQQANVFEQLHLLLQHELALDVFTEGAELAGRLAARPIANAEARRRWARKMISARGASAMSALFNLHPSRERIRSCDDEKLEKEQLLAFDRILSTLAPDLLLLSDRNVIDYA